MAHVDLVIGKPSSGLYASGPMVSHCEVATLVHTHISYDGIRIYGATTKKTLERILLQQKQALITIFSFKK